MYTAEGRKSTLTETGKKVMIGLFHWMPLSVTLTYSKLVSKGTSLVTTTSRVWSFMRSLSLHSKSSASGRTIEVRSGDKPVALLQIYDSPKYLGVARVVTQYSWMEVASWKTRFSALKGLRLSTRRVITPWAGVAWEFKLGKAK